MSQRIEGYVKRDASKTFEHAFYPHVHGNAEPIDTDEENDNMDDVI